MRKLVLMALAALAPLAAEAAPFQCRCKLILHLDFAPLVWGYRFGVNSSESYPIPNSARRQAAPPIYCPVTKPGEKGLYTSVYERQRVDLLLRQGQQGRDSCPEARRAAYPDQYVRFSGRVPGDEAAVFDHRHG